jgi:hypothetical protein
MVLQPNDSRLFWNRGGQVACGIHAPSPTSEEWIREGWRLMTIDEEKMFAELARKGAIPPTSCDVCDELGTHP